jgi:hypothetical protein
MRDRSQLDGCVSAARRNSEWATNVASWREVQVRAVGVSRHTRSHQGPSMIVNAHHQAAPRQIALATSRRSAAAFVRGY